MNTKTFNKWLNDPFVRMAAKRSGFAGNRDVDRLMSALSEVLVEIEQALPGMDVDRLRAWLESSPVIDVHQVHRDLMASGHPAEDVNIICHAIDPSFAMA